MNKRIYTLLYIIGLLITGIYVQAQTPVMSIGGNPSSKEVYLQSLNISVDVVGNVATTLLTMTFKNRTNKTLEGELTFPLPEGATVSRFALDINGKMREAVPVDKAKGTHIFEEIERRRVDPGLLEKVEGNNFRTRVYPIMPNASRTVTIGYEQELLMMGNALHYKLPMDYKEKIEQFSINATVWKANNLPRLEESFSDEIVFDKVGANYVAKFSRQDYMPHRTLSIALPKQDEVAEVLMQPADDSYYFLVNNFVKNKTEQKRWSNNIGIVWDISLSALQRDTKKELELLGTIINQKKNLTIRLGLLNNEFASGGVFSIVNSNWDELRKVLETVTYDGGTNFSAIKLSQIASDEYILFSDGISSFGEDQFIINNTIHCVVSSPRSNYSTLKWITGKSGGKFINLNELSQEEAKSVLTEDALQLMHVEHSSNVREIYPSITTDIRNGNISVAGIADANNASITLVFGIGGNVMLRQVVQLDAGKYNSNKEIVSHIWAQKKISEMDIQYEKNKEDIIALGQQFGIVTRSTSLIVLETIQDYITYNITPPEELRNEYNQYLQGRGRNVSRTSQQEGSFLESAKQTAANLKTWWNTTFKISDQRYPKPVKKKESLNAEMTDFMIPGIVERAKDIAFTTQGEKDEVVVSGYLKAEKKISVVENSTIIKLNKIVAKELVLSDNTPKNYSTPKTQPVIAIVEIKQDKAYLKKLTGDIKKDYEQYLLLRKDYLGTAAFYFDMAQWFCKHKDTITGIRILSSIADMNLENAHLFKTLAYRLKEYGKYKEALFVTGKIMQWRSMEPQSYRDYALALADNGQYQAALDSLYGTLTRFYPERVVGANRGIEETIIPEINQLIALHGKQIKSNKIDTSLIVSMPLNIRVVLNYNVNDTYIDLHITDPSGENSNYGNTLSSIGGRISGEIIYGYGPQQYMLKKAMKGKYKIEVNYYGDSRVKEEGPASVMAEIYTNYADGHQQRKVISLQMERNTDHAATGKVLVGEFTF